MWIEESRIEANSNVALDLGASCQKVLEVFLPSFMPPNQTFHAVLHG